VPHLSGIIHRLTVGLLLVSVPACQAQQPATGLSRHAKRIQQILASCPANSHLHLVLSGHTDRFGYLGALSSTSFELLDPQTRSPAIISYEFVKRIDNENGPLYAQAGWHKRGSTGFLILIGIIVGVSVGILAAQHN
jgi:hypothetical protein